MPEPTTESLIAELRLYADQAEIDFMKGSEFARTLNGAADRLESLTADSFTGQMMHAHWQERAERAEGFVAWADASPAVTWAGRLGLKERWENRDNPEYQKMLRERGEDA